MGSRRSLSRTSSHWILGVVLLCFCFIGLMVASPFKNFSGTLYNKQPHAASAGYDKNKVVVGEGRSIQPLPHHIALSFDDGPDPQWTPKIVKILQQNNVRGTFFVIGDSVVKHPLTLQRTVNAGMEIGNHTFNHVSLGDVGKFRRGVEEDLTQTSIRAVTGYSTSLLRLPYSATPLSVTVKDDVAVKQSASKGYFSVFSTIDTEDWRRKDTTKEVLRQIDATPGKGQIILFHDGGGNRKTTVNELQKLIPELKKRGYTLGTVSETIGAQNSMQKYTGFDRVIDVLVFAGLFLASCATSILSWVILCAGGLAVLRVIILLLSANKHWNVQKRELLKVEEETPELLSKPVTVIIPAYNEEVGVEATVRSVNNSTHPVEIIVVDDGSTDSTLERARDIKLPNLTVLTKKNGGKPSALNAGIDACNTPLVVMVDGDTVLEPDAVENIIKPFKEINVGAVSGNAKVANRDTLLGKWQHIEYVLGFNMDRRMYDMFNCMPTVPGAIGAFRLSALREVGGLHTDTLAEDTDLTMDVGALGYRVAYQPDAIAWTEAPRSIRQLWSQRYRWSYGTMQAMWKHRKYVARRDEAGKYFRRCLTYMTFFQVIFPLMAPFVDVFAVYGLITGNFLRAGSVWMMFQILDLIVAVIAFRMDKEKLRDIFAMPFTQIFYRQMLYCVVIHSLATAITGVKLKWHKLERHGVFNNDTQHKNQKDNNNFLA